MGLFESAAFWIILAAASELIALSPYKENSVIEVAQKLIKQLLATRKK